jgi:hypothetical protein
MTDTPRTDNEAFSLPVPTGEISQGYVRADFARQLERENAELLEALKLLTSHGHADDCLLINRAGESCDCGLDYAHVIIAKAKGVQP